MMVHTIPESVRRAQLSGNHAELSRLGRKGNEVKKRKKLVRLIRLIGECAERDHEANLDICPVDDQ